jgi:uncharacterized ferredoxin-like protein
MPRRRVKFFIVENVAKKQAMRNFKIVRCMFCGSTIGFKINYRGGLNCKACGKQNYRYDGKEKDIGREREDTSFSDIST